MGKIIHGICIFCGDPRPETANLWKHIKQHLIPRDQIFTPICPLGAAVALARPTEFPIKFASIMEDIEFALREFAQSQFIVVGHDCGIYKRLAPQVFTLEDKVADIIIAADFLRGRFPGTPVSAFFKKVGSGFDEVS